MQLKFNLVSILMAISLVGWPIGAYAQNAQNWLTNEASKIQADYGSGAINQSQAGRLQQGTARILSEEQQAMARQGGVLTPQQQGQFGSEIRKLNEERRKDVQRDNPDANGNGGYYPQQYPAQGQYYGNQGGYQGGYPGGYQGGYQGGYNSNFAPYQGQPAPGTQGQYWQNNPQMLNNQYNQPYSQGYQGAAPGQSQFSIPFFHHRNQNN
jgi:hypothetical protein